MNLTIEQITQNILDGEIIDRTSLEYLNEVFKNDNSNTKSKKLVRTNNSNKRMK